jgi:hypothetical protein
MYKGSTMTKRSALETNSEPARWVTLTEASGIVERAVTNLSKMCGRERIKPRKDGLYPLDKIIQAVEDASKRDLRNCTNGPSELKAEKLREEIGILRARRAELEGKTVGRDEALASARELVAMFRDVFAQWVGAVKVMTGDAKLVAEAERLRDRALLTMQERLK